MAYCTQTDLEEQIANADLIDLSDDAGSGAVDTSVIARSIADADAEIDSYCGSRYTVPFSPVPVIIRKSSVDMAIYHLFSRRSVLKVSEERQKRYDSAIRFLKDVSRSLVNLGADAPATVNAENQVNIAGNARIFTREKMSGF